MSPVYMHTRAAQIEDDIAGDSNDSRAQHTVTSGAVNSPIAFNSVVRDTRLRKVIQMIESEGLSSVQSLAVEVNLSSSHLQHLFKQHIGVCITHLLTEQKLRKAAHHLEASDMSVKEVAYAVGYEHASSFIRAFQRYFRLTPREYRLQTQQARSF